MGKRIHSIVSRPGYGRTGGQVTLNYALGRKLTGIVVAINPKRGMVAVRTSGGYSIFEMLGDDPPEKGDQIKWDGSKPLGGETVYNVTQDIGYDVFFQNHDVSKKLVHRQLLFE